MSNKTVVPLVASVAGFVLTFDNGVTVDRSQLPPPPRGDKYQNIVDEIVSRGNGYAFSRGQLVSLVRDITGESDENKYMRSIRWMTNMRNRYRPCGKRTLYVMPLTDAERKGLAMSQAPTANVPAATPTEPEQTTA